MTLKVTQGHRNCRYVNAKYHFLLVPCSNHDSIFNCTLSEIHLQNLCVFHNTDIFRGTENDGTENDGP